MGFYCSVHMLFMCTAQHAISDDQLYEPCALVLKWLDQSLSNAGKYWMIAHEL